MIKPFAWAVPRKHWWEVAMTKTIYIEGPRSARDNIPILYYSRNEAGTWAEPVRLPDNCHVVIEEESPLNNQTFFRNLTIATDKQLYRLLSMRP